MKTKCRSSWKKVVKKVHDLLEEKLQKTENNIKLEINEIQVELNTFKIQNGLHITNLKETISNIEQGPTFVSRKYERQKENKGVD